MEKNALKRKSRKILIGVLSILLITITGLFITENSISPAYSINKKYMNTDFEVHDEIAHMNSIQDKNIIISFYYNNSSQINCAVLKKHFWGYEILRLSGQLPPNDVNRAERRILSAINRGKDGNIYWGILYDHSISKVLIESHDANVINTNDIKLWYYFGESSIDIHNIVFVR